VNGASTPTTATAVVPRDEATRLQALREQRRVFDLLGPTVEGLWTLLHDLQDLYRSAEDPRQKLAAMREYRKTAIEFVIARTVPTMHRVDHRALVMQLPIGAGEAPIDQEDAARARAEQAGRERTELLRQLLAQSHSNGNGNGHGSRAGLVILPDARRAG
jgi:hypothetical protein